MLKESNLCDNPTPRNCHLLEAQLFPTWFVCGLDLRYATMEVTETKRNGTKSREDGGKNWKTLDESNYCLTPQKKVDHRSQSVNRKKSIGR